MTADHHTPGWDRLLAHVLGRRDEVGITPPIVALLSTSYRWTDAELDAFAAEAAPLPDDAGQPTSR